MDIVEREFAAEPVENVPPRHAAPPPARRTGPATRGRSQRDPSGQPGGQPDGDRVGAYRDDGGTPAVPAGHDLDVTMRQQAENNKLQAELNGAVVHRALSTVKQLAESAVRPVVPGKSATEVFGEGAGQTIG